MREEGLPVLDAREAVGPAVTRNLCFSPVFHMYFRWLCPPVPSLPKSPVYTLSPLSISLTRFSPATLPEKYFHGGGFQYFIWEPQRYLTLA